MRELLEVQFSSLSQIGNGPINGRTLAHRSDFWTFRYKCILLFVEDSSEHSDRHQPLSFPNKLLSTLCYRARQCRCCACHVGITFRARDIFRCHLEWLQQQFRALGKGDAAAALALDLLAGLQGASLLTNSFHAPEFLHGQLGRLEAWLSSVA